MSSLSGKKVLIVIGWILVIGWMAFLFTMSAKVREESNDLSKGITEKIVETVEKVYPDAEIDISRFNHIIRKNAHFFGYLLLGILVSFVLRMSGVRGFKLFIFSLMFCVIYAISDEVHQHFVPGRGPQVRDVIIDSAGSTVGIAINFMVVKILTWIR